MFCIENNAGQLKIISATWMPNALDWIYAHEGIFCAIPILKKFPG